MINHQLLAALQEKGWSIEVASARVGVGRVTFSRWLNGHQEPQPALLESLCKVFGKSASDLGYGHLSKEPALADGEKPSRQEIPSTGLSLYTLADEQLNAFTSLLRLGESIMFDPTKRKMLETLLTALSIAVVKPQTLLQGESWQQLLTPETSLAKTNEVTIQGFESLINACWQLSRGNELALAERLLPECMSRLVPLAQQPSKHQQAAAHLAAQGYRLYSILALHKNDLFARELYDKQAIQYSLLAGNQGLLIAVYKGLGGTYYYTGQYQQSLEAYLDALQHVKQGESCSPLLQALVHMGLAVAYAHIGQRQNALTHLGLANDAFPDHPEVDPNFSYAEFDLSQMILWGGIAHSQLGETSKALDLFNRIEQPGIIVPERLRIEIFNQRAKTAIASGDLEQGTTYVEAGVSGAKTLGSQRRLKEAYENFKQMALLWPQEKRVKALGEIFHA
jgi:tetratricopeptide (TPR) repeat protein